MQHISVKLFIGIIRSGKHDITSVFIINFCADIKMLKHRTVIMEKYEIILWFHDLFIGIFFSYYISGGILCIALHSICLSNVCIGEVVQSMSEL